MNDKIFREYDIRGVADRDLSDATLALLSRAIGTLLKNRGAKNVTLGRDCRLSSPRLHAAMTEGLRSCGLDIIDIGLVPTPLSYFSVFHLKAGGSVMITGSHNPPEHNGFKIMSGTSTLFGEDIQEIRRLMGRNDFAKGRGSVSTDSVKEAYIETILEGIKRPCPVEVVIDCGNGMAGVVARELYERMGCRVTELFGELDGAFPNHHPDPTMPENLKDLDREVRKRKTPLGIAYDGDADRIGAIDRTGKVIPGDELMVIFSRAVLNHSPGARIISEVKASHRLFQDIARHGGVPIMWKTGHSLIKAKMKEEKALLAGEMSGHIFFADRYFGYDDAIYAGARLLEIVSQSGKTPAELIRDVPASFSTPEIRVDCPDDRKFSIVEAAKEKLIKNGYNVNSIDGARVEFEDGWGLVRASNTQPVLVYRFEATSEKRLAEIRSLIEGTVSTLLARG